MVEPPRAKWRFLFIGTSQEDLFTGGDAADHRQLEF
jgi:hypothetical protein